MEEEKEEDEIVISPVVLALAKRLDDNNAFLDDILHDIHSDEKFDHNLTVAAKKQAPAFFKDKKVTADTVIKFFGLNFLKIFTLVSLMKEVILNRNLWFEACFMAKAAQTIAEKLELDSKVANDVFIAALFLKFGESVQELEEFKGRRPFVLSAEMVESFGLKTNAHKVLENLQRNFDESIVVETTIVEVAMLMVQSRKEKHKSLNSIFNSNKKLLQRMINTRVHNVVSSKLLRDIFMETKKISFFADELVNVWL